MKILGNERHNFPNNPGLVSGHRMDQRGPRIGKYKYTTLHNVTSHVQCAIAMCIAAPAGTVTILCPILGGGQTVRTAPARPKK